MTPQSITVPSDHAGATLAALVRGCLPGRSWSEVRRLIETRHVKIGKDLCLDPARRLHEGDVIEIATRPAPKPEVPEDKIIRHLDEHVVVAEKPAGMNTVRHPAERSWPLERRQRSPTLEDILPPLVAMREGKKRKGPPPRLRVVQRLDKETSGLVVFARTPLAQRELARQFHRHTVVRRYLAVVPGYLAPQRIANRLVRDRGDGRRGGTTEPGIGKEATTHVEVRERLGGYTLLECRLETGRTHQIRIHLAELGHPVCGDPVYFANPRPGAEVRKDTSGAPRLALHAAELGFTHPVGGELLHWEMPLPQDLQDFVEKLRKTSKASE
ncbi:ribosomal large subunit pseudouridine synthase D [Planctomycetaceae bacterium SCGC AG-212-D15]|nr:ribosomal large subunit pseudouridine synthase D [Planctomycetaceae bacterium SCGC AG-212-D15]